MAAFLPIAKPDQRAFQLADIILGAAVSGDTQFPGRTFVLQEGHDAAPDATRISYADLLRMIIEADSNIVI